MSGAITVLVPAREGEPSTRQERPRRPRLLNVLSAALPQFVPATPPAAVTGRVLDIYA